MSTVYIGMFFVPIAKYTLVIGDMGFASEPVNGVFTMRLLDLAEWAFKSPQYNLMAVIFSVTFIIMTVLLIVIIVAAILVLLNIRINISINVLKGVILATSVVFTAIATYSLITFYVISEMGFISVDYINYSIVVPGLVGICFSLFILLFKKKPKQNML